MKNYESRIIDFKHTHSKQVYVSCLLVLMSWFSFAQQISSSIDSTSIKIGEQITYKIQVTADTTDLVVFPEGCYRYD